MWMIYVNPKCLNKWIYIDKRLCKNYELVTLIICGGTWDQIRDMACGVVFEDFQNNQPMTQENNIAYRMVTEVIFRD